MPTNVINAGPARTYGSGWSTAGQAVNEGLGQVLGYYQEYQRQKRFELQQTQEAKIRAQEMADRAEEKKWINEERMDVRNARQAQNAERDAMMLTPEQALAMPEYTTETKTMVPNEMLKMTTPGDAELGIKEQTVEMPSFSQKEELKKELLRTKKYGDYTAVLDYGGEQARRAASDAKQADWLAAPSDITIGDWQFKKGEKVPPAIAALAGKDAPTPKTENIGGRLKGFNTKTGAYDIDYGPAGSPRVASGDSTPGGAYKAVYDKTAKADVMANDAMIAKDPARYGPAKKEGGSGKPLLGGEIGTIKDFASGMDMLSSLLDEAQGTGTVEWAKSKTPNMLAQWTGWGVDAKSRQASLDAAKQVIGKAMEGGVLRKEDEAKYMKILPVLGDVPEVARRKIGQLVTTMKRDSEKYLDILEGAGRDVTGVREIIMKGGAAAEAAVGREEKTVNGKTYVKLDGGWAPKDDVKVVGGKTYRRVAGGWDEVK